MLTQNYYDSKEDSGLASKIRHCCFDKLVILWPLSMCQINQAAELYEVTNENSSSGAPEGEEGKASTPKPKKKCCRKMVLFSRAV